jgi:fucose permease
MALFFAFGLLHGARRFHHSQTEGNFRTSHMTEVMLTQFCFFGAYFLYLASRGMAASPHRLSARRCGRLLLMALGCLLFTAGG